MRFFAPVFLIGSIIGCSAVGPSPREVLEKTVASYHDHLRWKRFEQAAHFVTAKQRKDFLGAFEGAEETLHIDDLEVKNTDIGEDKRATVTVNVHFYKIPSVTLQKMKWKQVWEHKGGDWWLVENTKGPFFDDPASKPTKN